MKQKLKMFLTAMLALLILVSVMPMQYVHAEDGAVEAESIGADVSAASVQTKLDRLRELLVGKYFTVDQKACTHGSSGTCKNCKNSNVIATSWFKNLFGTVSVNNFPEHYNVNGGQFYATAYECAGFAAFAGWYIFADSNSEKIKVIDANPSNRSFNYSTMQAYAKPGDILRLSKNSSGNTGHSAILVSFDSNGITVIDCNYVGRSLVGYHSIKYSSKYNYVAISRCDKEPLDPPPVTPTHTVTFKDGYTGGTISTATVNHGGTAALPTPPDHSGDGYHFVRWDGDNTNVTSDRTVTAMYEINKYTVTFKDGFTGGTISTATVNHGGTAALPTPPDHSGDGYHFARWDGNNTNVTSDRTVTAMYEINQYVVTFVDGFNNEVISQVTVNHGDDVEFPDAPNHEDDGYRFTYWDGDNTNVTEARTIMAMYNTYKITFVDGHTGEIVDIQWVNNGEDAIAPTLPYAEIDGYRYEWDKDFTNVKYPMTVTANFTYRVSFVDEHTNETVSVQWIAHGSDATAPELPYTEADGYRYAWDRDFTNINDTMVVTARFTYRVRFIDQHTDEIVSEQWIVRGSDATAPELPYTEADGYRYAWDEECTNVTDTMVITARFTYRVRFIDGFDNTMLDERWIEHGEATEIPQAPHHYGYHLTVWCCQNDAGTVQHNCEHVDGVLEPLNVTALYERHMYNVTLKWSSCGTVDPGMDIGESGVLEGLGYGDTITLKMNPDYGHYVWYITINGEIVIVRPGNTYAIELLSDVDGDTYDIFVMFRTDSAEASTPTTPTSPTKPPKTGAAAMTAVAIMAIISGAGIMLARKK